MNLLGRPLVGGGRNHDLTQEPGNLGLNSQL